MRLIGILLFSLVLNVFANEQTSIYQRALEAESTGDIVGAITLLEEALLTEGPYSSEILEILKQYYDVLGIDFIERERHNNWRFSLNLDAIEIHYKEKESLITTKEWLGEVFSILSLAYDINHHQIKHSIELSFLSEFFWKSDSSSLDTNDWALSPTLQYTLMSKSFILSSGVDFTLNEKNGFNPAFFVFFEKDAFKKDFHWFALDGFAFINKIFEMRYGINFSWNLKKKEGLSMSVSLGVHLNVDSTASISLITDDNYFDGVELSYYDLSYFHGAKWGPSFHLNASYQFDNPLGVETKWRLAPSFLINEKNNASLSFLEGGIGCFLFVKWQHLRFHLGVDQFFNHYLNRPVLWNGLIPKTAFFTELKLGTKINF